MDANGRKSVARLDEMDARLKNWGTHLERAKQFERRACRQHERHVHDMQVNAADLRRAMLEERQLLEHAQTPLVDKVRGKPNFFQLPPHLKRHPSLQAVLTKKQDYEIPTLEYVAIPKAIQKEKHYKEPSPRRVAMQNSYKLRRLKELKPGIRRLQLHKPCLSELALVGTKAPLVNDTKSTETLHHESINEEHVEEATGTAKPVAAISIEGKPFLSSDSEQQSSQHYVTIDTDTNHKGTIMSSSIRLTNIGELVVHYYWDLVTEPTVLDYLPGRPPAHCFVFRRNLSRLLPGETEVLHIHFLVGEAGVYKETWKLLTAPSVFSNGQFMLRLWANVDCSLDVAARIEQRIAIQLRDDLVARTVHQLLARVEASEHFEDVKHLVHESDLFEVTNSDYSTLGKEPLVYCYNKCLVTEMKRLYAEVRSENDPPCWNYNLQQLCALIKTNTSGSAQVGHLIIYDDILDKFTRIRKEDTFDFDYEQAYQILCSMFDTMTRKINELRGKFQLRKLDSFSKVPVEPQPEFKVEEPKLSWLRRSAADQEGIPGMDDIPTHDVDARYKLYQKVRLGIIVNDSNNSEHEKSKGPANKAKKKGKEDAKTKKKEPDEKSKKKEDTAKSKKSEKSRHSLSVKQQFSDLSVEEFTSIKSRTFSVGPEILSPTSLELYQLNLYSIVYTILAEHMDELEDTLTNADRPVDRDTLRKIIELRNKTGMDFTINDFDEVPTFSSISLPSLDFSKDVSLASICSAYSLDHYKSNLPADWSENENEANISPHTSATENLVPSSSREVSKTIIFKPKAAAVVSKALDDYEVNVEELLKRHLKIDDEPLENLDENDIYADIKSGSEVSEEFFY